MSPLQSPGDARLIDPDKPPKPPKPEPPFPGMDEFKLVVTGWVGYPKQFGGLMEATYFRLLDDLQLAGVLSAQMTLEKPTVP